MLQALRATLCTAAASAAALASAPALATTVQVADDIMLLDAARGRDLPIKVYFPQEPGRYPLIIFSHGLGGSKEDYEYLGRYWASRGYVSIHPQHPGSDRALLTPGKPIKNANAISRAEHDEKNWTDRPKDISFIISSLAELEAKAPGLKDKIDAGHIGVGGHSFGAHTAMVIAGGELSLGGHLTSLKDDRPRAFIALSPQGEGTFGWTEHSWDKIRAPMMTMSGTLDRGMEGQPAEWRRSAFKHMPAGDKFQVVIEEATHFTFAGNAGERFLRPIEELTTAFWDAYLKDNAKERERLKSGAAWAGSGVRLQSK